MVSFSFLFLDLRRNFGKVPPCQVAFLNSTVVLPCAPPVGSPPANVTWYKIGESSSLFRNKGRRRVRSGRLIIKRSRVGDSGEYRCVAQNIAARREGPVIRVVVGGMAFGICWFPYFFVDFPTQLLASLLPTFLFISLITCWFPYEIREYLQCSV